MTTPAIAPAPVPPVAVAPAVPVAPVVAAAPPAETPAPVVAGEPVVAAVAPVVPPVEVEAAVVPPPPVDPKVVEPVVPPVELAVKYPEGYQGDADALAAFLPLAKDLGLDSAKAQKLIDFNVAQNKAQEARADAELTKTRAGWKESLKNDKELGGPNFEANQRAAGRVVSRYGDQEIRDFLNNTGLGDHPLMVRLMYRVGKSLGEDSVAGRQGAVGTLNSDESFLRKQYPTMFPKT